MEKNPNVTIYNPDGTIFCSVTNPATDATDATGFADAYCTSSFEEEITLISMGYRKMWAYIINIDGVVIRDHETR